MRTFSMAFVVAALLCLAGLQSAIAQSSGSSSTDNPAAQSQGSSTSTSSDQMSGSQTGTSTQSPSATEPSTTQGQMGGQAGSVEQSGTQSPTTQGQVGGTVSGTQGSMGSSTSGSNMGATGGATEAGLEDQPRMHFDMARQAFERKDYAAAQQHIQEGANIVQREAARATGANAEELKAAHQELLDLARRVGNGSVTSVNDLNADFGDAYQALSKHYYTQAQTSWEQYQAASEAPGAPGAAMTAPQREVGTRVGRDLDAAERNFRHWAEVSGTKVKEGTGTVLGTTKRVAGSMISGTGWAARETGEAIHNFGREIKQYGDKMKMHRSTSSSGSQSSTITTEPQGQSPSSVPPTTTEPQGQSSTEPSGSQTQP